MTTDDNKRSHHEAFGPPAQDVALATEVAAIGATPATQLLAIPHHEPPLKRWWALKSGLTGKYVTDDVYLNDDCVMDFRGGVLAFFDRDDAERRASSLREDHPQLLVTVVRLPSSPPDVVQKVRHNDGEPVAAFLHVVVGNESVRIELRPETLSRSLALMTLLGQIVESAAQNIAHARISPITLLTLGPVPAQVDLRDAATNAPNHSDSEAA